MFISQHANHFYVLNFRCGCRLRPLPAMQHGHCHALRSSRTPCPSAISHGTWKGHGGSWKNTLHLRKGPLRHLWKSWTRKDEGCYKGYSHKLQEEEVAMKAGTVTALVELVEIPTTTITGSTCTPTHTI